MPEVYEGPGLRMFSDIDVLIKEEDGFRVDELLKKSGLKEFDETDKWDKYRSQRVYITDGNLTLDVHVDFIGRRLHNKLLKIDKEAIWKNKKTVSIDGTGLSTMDPVHTLLYQCLHLAVQHSFFGLSGYVDINEIVNKYREQLDWDEVLRLAAEYRIKRPVYYSLIFTKNLLGCNIPDKVFEVLSRARRRSDKWVFKKIKTHNRAGDYLAELVLFDTWWDTIKFTVLSFITYPHLFTHFFRISGRILKEIFTPSDRKEA